MTRSFKPSEEIREQLKRAVAQDGRGWDGIGEVVGVKGPTLHRFLNTPGAGSDCLPRLLKLFGLNEVESSGLDEEQKELLRVFEAARDQGRDGKKLVSAFRIITGVEPPSPMPAPPKSRGSSES